LIAGFSRRRLEVSGWSGRHSTSTLNGGLIVAARGELPMGAKEIIVTLLVAIFVGFAIAFAVWSTKNDTDGARRDPKEK
jgi:hypothetical protein